MGCWKGTCMVSGLPIDYHDRIKLIFLKKGDESIFSAGVCYPNEILKPILLPISGQYDDYGGIENCDKDWNYHIVEQHFKESYKDGLIIDEEELVEPLTVEMVVYGIERKKMQCRIPDIDPLNERFMEMMRNSATDEELRDLKRYENISNNGWYDANLSCVMILEQVWNEIVEFQGKITSNFHISPNMTWFDYKHTKFDKYIKGLLDNDDESPLRRVMLRFGSIWTPSGENEIKYVSDEYAKYCDENRHNETLLADVKKQWTEFALIDKTLQDLRRCWMISSGLGSQQTFYKSHIFLSNVVLKIAEERLMEEDE